MQTNQKWKPIVVFSLLGVNTVAAALILLYLFVPKAPDKIQDQLAFDVVRQYILYIGTNDKDTYEQIIPVHEAREIVNEICSRYVSGYTVMEAMGGWVDEKGILTQEHTLVYIFIYTDESAVISIMREALTALNQDSILIEKRDVGSYFFYGK